MSGMGAHGMVFMYIRVGVLYSLTVDQEMMIPSNRYLPGKRKPDDSLESLVNIKI